MELNHWWPLKKKEATEKNSQEKAVPPETYSEPLSIPAVKKMKSVRQFKHKGERLVKEQLQKKFCIHCRRAGHNTSDCWYKQHCEHCGRQGHAVEGYCTKVQYPSTMYPLTTPKLKDTTPGSDLTAQQGNME